MTMKMSGSACHVLSVMVVGATAAFFVLAMVGLSPVAVAALLSSLPYLSEGRFLAR